MPASSTPSTSATSTSTATQRAIRFIGLILPVSNQEIAIRLETALVSRRQDINPTSTRRDKEYAGYFYADPDGSYSHTAPHPLGQAGGSSRRPHGKDLGGFYHTHGGNDPGYDNEHYSDTDNFTAENLGGANYLG